MNMHNHVVSAQCGPFCSQWTNPHPCYEYLPYPAPEDARFDTSLGGVKTTFELWDGRIVERLDCHPESFGYDKGLVAYESIDTGNITYVPNVKVWWTE
jgi:hypothetical protein